MNLLEQIAFDEKWMQIEQLFLTRFGKIPDLEGMLYLIGINELGNVPDKNFTKEQKQDLIHIATCTLLSQSGYYEYAGHDEAGWPHYNVAESLPALDALQQELLIKQLIIAYFDI